MTNEPTVKTEIAGGTLTGFTGVGTVTAGSINFYGTNNSDDKASSPSLPPDGHKPVSPDLHSIGDRFTGRDAFMERLRDSLRRQGGNVSAIRALRGLGGIGKTRAAMEYAMRHRDDYTALLFVRAPDPATLERGIAALTGVLRLPAAAETDANRESVLRWLANHSGWLLILDNVDTPEALRAASALARSLRSGHVLLTSRLEGSFAQDIEPLDLGLLAPGDAVAYLLKTTEGRRRPEPDAQAQAAALAGAVDYLTLALVHAAAYVAERRITFAAYLAAWDANHDRVLAWANQDVTGYPLSLMQTWITSVDQLTPAGRALLERLSFLGNDPVPEFLLDVALPGAEAAEGLDPLVDVARFSLVTRDPEADRFTLHRIVRDVTNRRLGADPAAHRARLTEALGWINAAFTGSAQDVRSWPRLDPLAPHAEAVAWAADTAGIAEPTGRLMGDLSTLFNTKAQSSRAEIFGRRALAISEANLGPDHPTVAIYLSILAQLLKATNRLAEAEAPMRRVVGIFEASLGPEHPNVATAINNLAVVIETMGRIDEAEAMYLRALAIDEASYGLSHPQVAIRLNNLADTLKNTNRLAEAEPLMRRMVVIFLAFQCDTGHAHPHRDAAIGNYERLLSEMGRDEAAIHAAIEDAAREAGLG